MLDNLCSCYSWASESHLSRDGLPSSSALEILFSDLRTRDGAEFSRAIVFARSFPQLSCLVLGHSQEREDIQTYLQKDAHGPAPLARARRELTRIQELRADREVVLGAVVQRGDALRYASQELWGGSPELQSPLRDLTQFKSFLGLDFFARVLRCVCL